MERRRWTAIRHCKPSSKLSITGTQQAGRLKLSKLEWYPEPVNQLSYVVCFASQGQRTSGPDLKLP